MESSLARLYRDYGPTLCHCALHETRWKQFQELWTLWNIRIIRAFIISTIIMEYRNYSTSEISHDSRNEFIKIFYGKCWNKFVSRCIPVRLDIHHNTNNFFSSLSRQTVLTAVVSTQKLPNYFDVSRRWYSSDKWQLCEWKSFASLSNEIQVIVQGTRGRRAKKRKRFAFRFSYFLAAFVFFFVATVYTKNVSLIKRFLSIAMFYLH